jgi:hypothetical protein
LNHRLLHRTAGLTALETMNAAHDAE